MASRGRHSVRARSFPPNVCEPLPPRNFLTNCHVYFVLSQRAGGLSIGINMNPDKRCNFDCVYCEVDRRKPGGTARVPVREMTAELEGALALAGAGGLRVLARGPVEPGLLELKEVALLAASLLFFLPGGDGRRAMDWPDAVKIDWGIVLLFGGGLSLGSLMFSTGVARVMGESAAGWFGAGAGLWTLTALAIAVGILLSETTSNTSSATMLCPVIIAIADGMNVSPVAPTLGACLGASMGFMLPVSTPPNAIVYGSGLVPLTAMLRAGLLFDVLGFAIIWCGLRVMCPLLGLA